MVGHVGQESQARAQDRAERERMEQQALEKESTLRLRQEELERASYEVGRSTVRPLSKRSCRRLLMRSLLSTVRPLSERSCRSLLMIDLTLLL